MKISCFFLARELRQTLTAWRGGDGAGEAKIRLLAERFWAARLLVLTGLRFNEMGIAWKEAVPKEDARSTADAEVKVLTALQHILFCRVSTLTLTLKTLKPYLGNS